jgi:hypothetical protein
MTKRNLFLCTLFLTMFLTACSHSEPQPAAQAPAGAPPGQEVKAPANTGATSDNPNVVKGDGGAVGAIAPPPQQAAVAIPAPPVVDLANAPKIELVSKKVDFGKVKEDKKIVRELVVKNVGKSVLNIDSVNPSCGCTTVDFPKAIQPGKSGKIKLQVDTGKGSGVRTKTVTINSNDPQEKAVTVEFSFTLP